MLAFRILTTLLMRNGLLVKGKQFKNDRRIGSVLQTVNVFQQREIPGLHNRGHQPSKKARGPGKNLFSRRSQSGRGDQKHCISSPGGPR